MLVSWKWLKEYVEIPVSHQELAERLSLAGLNHESTQVTADDVVIDLEVTSNRGDCLSHIGVAREIATLFDQPLSLPEAEPAAKGPPVETVGSIANQMPDACPRYTARIVQGVRVGSSPAWLADRLRNLGVAVINNVVDITNYVMFECGQPLHAFDLGKLRGQQIIVRPARLNEPFQAIDHRTYSLQPSMCVIADRDRAVAIAGVMGGAETEVTEQTRDVLLEAAVFAPRSVRQTARALKLHSPSSHRFERRLDPHRVDWASRRACDLIVQLAGGTLADGVLATGSLPTQRAPITLRLEAIERLLGITIDPVAIERILNSLGCEREPSSSRNVSIWRTPSWRHDLEREVDLIEEVARVHGYDTIPADVPVPVISSRMRLEDELLEKLRGVLAAAGLDEAMTPSVVTAALDDLWSPWTKRDALQTEKALLEGSHYLRRSLVPSLLASRRANRTASQLDAELYEVARIYLPGDEPAALPSEPLTLGMVVGRPLLEVKGIVESLLRALHIDVPLLVEPDRTGIAHQLRLGAAVIGYFGQVSNQMVQQLKIDRQTVYAELTLGPLFAAARSVPQYRPVSPFPAMQRDLNLVMDESIPWASLAATIRSAAGQELTELQFREIYRDPQRDGAGRKRVLFSMQLQRPDRTLTGTAADQIATAVVNACEQAHGARLLAS